MEAMKCTYHAGIERQERATAILTEVGLGEEVHSILRRDKKLRWAKHTITDTGVILITSPDEGRIITLYVATAEQAKDLFGGRRVPAGLMKTVKKNEKRFAYLYKLSA